MAGIPPPGRIAMPRPPRASLEDLMVLLIDAQPGFLDGWMAGEPGPLLARLRFLLGLAAAYDLPCLATFEQPDDRNGWLPPALESVFPAHGQKLVKRSFGCCGEPGIPEALAAAGRRQVAVAGAETDVCVLQSVLGLIAAGYEVFLLEDCVSSSEPAVGPALRRMEAAGAVPATVKILAYELRGSVAEAGAPAILAARTPAIVLPRPEDLPAWDDRA
jgi:nicotinamidase-related amidase